MKVVAISSWKKAAAFVMAAVLLLLTVSCSSWDNKNGEATTNANVSTAAPEDQGDAEGKAAHDYLVYLSPSKQFDNDYVDSGTEGEHMYHVAQEMLPYLEASGVKYILADPEDELYTRAEQSNEAKCDLYLSIHSNGDNGSRRGTIAFYRKDSAESERFADVIISNFTQISPTPDRLMTRFDPHEPGEKGLIETREPQAPAVLVELAYHDNVEDAKWIRSHIKEIAKNLVQSITETLGVPFHEPE